MGCLCDWLWDLYDLLGEPWNWEALGTWFLGIVALYVAFRQYQIERYKKNDFLYQHRLKLYSEFFDSLYKLNKEKHWDSEVLQQYRTAFGRLQYEAKVLFNDEHLVLGIRKIFCLCERAYYFIEDQEKLKRNVKPTHDVSEYTKEVDKLRKYLLEEHPEVTMQELFYKYLNLDGKNAK